MAGHVNGAIGVKFAHPDRPVVVGCGDGCYSLSGFELMTAVEHDIPVIWVIFNDGEFKLIKLYQLSTYQGERTGRVPEPRLRRLRPRLRRRRLHASRTLEEFERAFAAALRLEAAERDRRQDLAPRPSALQPVAGGRRSPASLK